MITDEAYDSHQSNWNDRLASAEDMVPLVGRLYRERGIETSVFGRMLVNRGVVEIIKAHRFARQVEGEELSVFETLPVLRIIEKASLGPVISTWANWLSATRSCFRTSRWKSLSWTS